MLRSGQVFEHKYQIIRRLGEGGMGLVFEAMHCGLQRRVAIKVLRNELMSEAALARFRREAHVLARLNHPNVTQILDIDETATGTPYMVMEYLDGRDLARELQKRGQLPLAEAVGYVLQACSGVSEAHGNGIIHRDLKPPNLFITNLHGPRQIKVLDFGVAKVDDGSESLTQTTHSLGTPVYMSPEQVESAKNVDQRTDVWALATVLYQMLDGAPPFRRDSHACTIAALLVDEPVSLLVERPDVPQEVDDLIRQALSKEVHARPALDELMARLRAFGPGDEPIAVRATRGSSLAPPLQPVPVDVDQKRAEPSTVVDDSDADGLPVTTLAAHHDGQHGDVRQGDVQRSHRPRKGSQATRLLGVVATAMTAVAVWQGATTLLERHSQASQTLGEPANEALRVTVGDVPQQPRTAEPRPVAPAPAPNGVPRAGSSPGPVPPTEARSIKTPQVGSPTPVRGQVVTRRPHATPKPPEAEARNDVQETPEEQPAGPDAVSGNEVPLHL